MFNSLRCFYIRELENTQFVKEWSEVMVWANDCKHTRTSNLVAPAVPPTLPMLDSSKRRCFEEFADAKPQSSVITNPHTDGGADGTHGNIDEVEPIAPTTKSKRKNGEGVGSNAPKAARVKPEYDTDFATAVSLKRTLERVTSAAEITLHMIVSGPWTELNTPVIVKPFQDSWDKLNTHISATQVVQYLRSLEAMEMKKICGKPRIFHVSA